MRFTLALLVSAAALFAQGCGHSDAATSTADGEAIQAKTPEGPVSLDSKMLSAIRIEPVVEREVANVFAVAGKVQFDEDRVARIVVPLGGQVIDLRVKVGDAVRRGDALCAINSREAAASVGEYIEARKDVELAEKTAAMTEDLFAHEAASRIAMQQAQSDLAKARSRAARTEESLRVLGLNPRDDLDGFNGRLPITAPLTGVVIERKVTAGQFVQSDGTPIMTIADLSTVWVVGDVFERDLQRVSPGQAASITTAAYPGETFHGRVDYISDSIDAATRTAKVRVSVANPGGRLKPEMFASVSLDLEAHDRVVLVPADAVFTEDGHAFVYAQVGSGRFARRAVDVAQSEGPMRRVMAGLRPGDRVVVDGALLLRQHEQRRAG
jgi:cobalt-zinc-cadmium efflux system membrane fusion protein